MCNSCIYVHSLEAPIHFFATLVALHFTPAVTRLWRVPATLPYPDFFFTTRTLPGNFSKISGFRVVTIHAVFSLVLYQWCQPLSSCRKGFSKDCKHLHICPFTRFRNIKVKNLVKYRVRTNISVIFMDMALVLNVQKVKKEWAGIKY